MPLIPFKLFEEMGNKRRNLIIFISSAIVGASLGAITSDAFSTNYYVLGVLLILIIFFVILVLYVTVNPPRIHDLIPVILAYDRINGTLLPITNRIAFVQGSFMKFRDGLEINPQPSEILKEKESKHSMQLALDLAIYELLDYLDQQFHSWWAPKERYRGKSIGITKINFKQEKEAPSEQIQYSDMDSEFKASNLFFKLYGTRLFLYKDLSFQVPRGTDFECAIKKIEGIDISQYTLSFKNRYCKMEMGINCQGWVAGLGPLNRYVESNEKREGYFARARYLQDRYAHVNLELEFDASFNWFWALFPSSNDYFNWVEYLCDSLDDYASFDKEDEALRNSKEKFELDQNNNH